MSAASWDLAPPRRLSRTTRVALILLAGTVMAALNLVSGPYDLSLAAAWQALVASGSANALHGQVLFELRAPRILLAAASGAALAVSGCAFQGLFRNPLADPSLLGVSTSAATGAVAFIVFGAPVAAALALPSVFALPLAATLGGVAGGVFLYALGRRFGALDISALLLTGIALNAVCSSLAGLLVFASDEQQLRELTFWSMGSLARAAWPTLLPALPLLALATGGLLTLGRRLNALALGEAAALHLGYHVPRVKALIVCATSLAVGVSVALSGVVAFVGLIVPHLVRALLGADNRVVLPASAAGGALLMLSADLLARQAVAPAELPIGIVTSLLGGPFFLYLMLRRRAGDAA